MTQSEGIFTGTSFDAYVEAPGVNQSMLQHMDPPARLPAYLAGGDDEETIDMIIGTLVHQRVMQPDLPLPRIHIKPQGMKFSTKEGKKWKADHGDGLILKLDEFSMLNGIVDSISKDSLCKKIFASGMTEVAAFKTREFPVGSVLRKARLDFVPPGNCLVDIKTFAYMGKEAFEKALLCREHGGRGYALQAAYYIDIWNDIHGDTHKETFVFIVAEKEPPYLIGCYLVDYDALGYGRRHYEKRLIRYIECRESNTWPGYPEGFQAVSIPERFKMR